MIQKRNTEGTYTYRFKSDKVRKAFKVYAAENGTSIQELITEALKTKYKSVKQ